MFEKELICFKETIINKKFLNDFRDLKIIS